MTEELEADGLRDGKIESTLKRGQDLNKFPIKQETTLQVYNRNTESSPDKYGAVCKKNIELPKNAVFPLKPPFNLAQCISLQFSIKSF